jgi:hypothetical protein
MEDVQEKNDERWSAQWETLESSHKPKTRRWYYTAGVIVVLSALDAYLANNTLFAALILVAGSIVLFSTRTPTPATKYELDWRGITINSETHRFNQFASFWLVEGSKGNILLLSPTKILQQQIIVPLGDTDLYNVQQLLSRHLPEVEDHIPLSHTITEYLGF